MYAKIIVLGSPITKSNFKLHNKSGRAILPNKSGKSHDKYALYEEEISYHAKIQNPDIILDESLIAILNVYYKSEKRHPDTANITKSIFDGIEKSGIIVNDAQIRKIIIQEFYDKENPRFELQLYPESEYCIDFKIKKNSSIKEKILYSNNKNKTSCISSPKNKSNANNKTTINENSLDIKKCDICSKIIKDDNFKKANNGKTLICNKCFLKLF